MVVSKTGGGGLAAGESVASAQPDGYTLGFFSGKQSLPEIYAKNVPYTAAALKPLFMMQFAAPVIAVKADSPWASLKEFIEFVRKNPGLQYASTGRGATPHLVAQKFAEVIGSKLADVPYGSDAEALTALLSGDVKVAFLNVTPAIPHAEAGKVRILAIHGVKRMSAVPNVPTFTEQGVNMPIGVLTYDAMFAPADLPDEIGKILIDTARKAADNPETIKGLETIGSAPHFAAGKDFQAILQEYRGIVGKLVKDLGLFQE
jgi:tripartite-type tricarboxylate transporter receptor subunit TctC